MKKKKTNKINKAEIAEKQEEQAPNSSPVCYADSKELRPEYLDNQEKTAKKE